MVLIIYGTARAVRWRSWFMNINIFIKITLASRAHFLALTPQYKTVPPPMSRLMSLDALPDLSGSLSTYVSPVRRLKKPTKL